MFQRNRTKSRSTVFVSGCCWPQRFPLCLRMNNCLQKKKKLGSRSNCYREYFMSDEHKGGSIEWTPKAEPTLASIHQLCVFWPLCRQRYHRSTDHRWRGEVAAGGGLSGTSRWPRLLLLLLIRRIGRWTLLRGHQIRIVSTYWSHLGRGTRGRRPERQMRCSESGSRSSVPS